MTEQQNTKKSFDIKEFLVNNALIIVVFAMILYVSFVKSNFLTLGNLKNILSNVSVRFIIALGVSGCLIIRGTDLSAGRIVGLAAVVTGTLVQKADFVGRFFPDLPNVPLVGALLAALVVGLVLGLFNGLVIAYLKVPPFLATLGTQIMVFGLNMVYSKSQPIGTFKNEFIKIGSGSLGPVPILVFIATAVGVFMWVLYNKTRYGKYMYAIGGNEDAAEVSGVNVTKMKVKIFVLAGLLYGLAGFLLASKTGSSAVSDGTGYELEAIAAATIGGVSTTGGVGTVPGILLGVFVFELLKTSLAYLGVTPAVTNVIQGAVIILAVAMDIRKTLKRK